jgi:hypothetical protein
MREFQRHSTDSRIPSEKYANAENSVEHGQVNVVAVNDPFIEPKYAVSPSFIL